MQMIWSQVITNGVSFFGNAGAANVNHLIFTTSDNTLKWYSGNAAWQLNGDGQAYNYCGIG